MLVGCPVRCPRPDIRSEMVWQVRFNDQTCTRFQVRNYGYFLHLFVANRSGRLSGNLDYGRFAFCKTSFMDSFGCVYLLISVNFTESGMVGNYVLTDTEEKLPRASQSQIL